MIKGIGTDIVDVERIKKAAIRTKSFLNKAFTLNEIEYFKLKKYKYESLAGIFAAKEAISKAFGTGFRQFNLQDIEIKHDDLGKPIVTFSEKINRKFLLSNCIVHISISHTNDKAIAFAIIEEVINNECSIS